MRMFNKSILYDIAQKACKALSIAGEEMQTCMDFVTRISNYLCKNSNSFGLLEIFVVEKIIKRDKSCKALNVFLFDFNAMLTAYDVTIGEPLI